jgi:uncharacterized protein YrrD
VLIVQRVNELFGKEIVKQASGEKQGTVRDLVFDGEARSIVALLVGGTLGRNRVVRWSSIVSLGDVVVVGGEASLTKPGDDLEVADLRKKSYRITGTAIVTEGGEKIGAVRDLFVDERGQVIGYEVSKGFVGDLGGRKFLPMTNIRAAGKDAIIVGDPNLASVKEAERGRG